MKKLLSVVLCLALLLSTAGFAAAELDEDGFVFRGGVRWGMTPEEVAASQEEQTSYPPDGDGTTAVLRVTFPAVSVFRADMLYYCFENSSLYAAFYLFESENPTLYLKRALGSLYGESGESAEIRAEFEAVLGQVPTVAVRAENVASLGQWQTEDGTVILLAAVDDIWVLAYYNLNYWAPEQNTDGL